MTLRLNGSTSGYVEIDAPATAGSNTLVLPTGNGTNGQYLQTNGSGSLSWAGVSGLPAQVLTLGTSVASTSGTAIDFTGIPSTVKRITVIFSDISLSGTANILIQLGDNGGVETTGYISTSNYLTGGSGSGSTSSTAGIILTGLASVNSLTGAVNLVKIDGNEWIATGTFNFSNLTVTTGWTAGDKTLSGTLDRVRITSTNGTDTFDAGTINIMYEG